MARASTIARVIFCHRIKRLSRRGWKGAAGDGGTARRPLMAALVLG